MALTKGQLRLLRPYLVGDRPKENGEWDMFCPLHGPEQKRSVSLNVFTGEWYCFSNCGGGTVEDLIIRKDIWCEPPSAAMTSNGAYHSTGARETVTDAHVSGWHSALMTSDERIDYLVNRGITEEVLELYEVGWDSSRLVYTIPVRSFKDELLNVRRYKTNPKPGAPKMFSVTGMGAPKLYPVSILEGAERIIIGEGEWDILATISRGYAAITRTASADTWRSEWNQFFKGKIVYLIHDCDAKGQKANRKVARALKGAADVRVVTLPYALQENHGKDLTDYWLEHSAEEFDHLLAEAENVDDDGSDHTDVEVQKVSVAESYNPELVGKPVQVSVTVTGKKWPGYSVPKKASLRCTQDAGHKCNICPLNNANGDDTLTIAEHDPITLELIEATNAKVKQTLAYKYKIPTGKCPRLDLKVVEHRSVSTLIARPDLDSDDGRSDTYTNITITALGKHDIPPNEAIAATGALHPNPNSQKNEFLAWRLEQTATSIDHFDITPESVELMKLFSAPHHPLRRLRHVANEMSQYVTHIVGRNEMHMLMDLTFHSLLGYKFGGRWEKHGWLDTLIVGDTRTGKSEAASALVRHYGVGEIVSGEMASVAGIIGGAIQHGVQWMIDWGIVPINDRRLVVLDEVSGFTPEQIAAFSDFRSTGRATITKIISQTANARTRLLWLGNPRNSKMSDYTYGVDAIRPLIGNNEDIARFDMAMSIALGEVPAELMNQPPKEGTLTYTAEACNALVLWAWTRQPDQVIWRQDAEQAVRDAANAMGRRYVEDPPLVQAANIRHKIARTAASLAARTFSTDNSHELVVIETKHVRDAVAFMDSLYRLGTFGYAERSEERIEDMREAEANVRPITKFLSQQPDLSKFMRNAAHFRTQDLVEMLDISKEEANSIVNKLFTARMVRKEAANIFIEPTLQQILRETAS